MSNGIVDAPISGMNRSKRPLVVSITAIFLGILSVGAIGAGIYYIQSVELTSQENLQVMLAAILVTLLGLVLAYGLWTLKDWTRISVILLIGLGLFFFLLVPSISKNRCSG